MKRIKKQLTIASIFSIVLLVCLLVRTNVNMLSVYAAGGTPDAYGDHINWVSVYQNVSSTWTFRGNITSANYTSGVQIKVDAHMQTRFNCSVHLNSTFASSTGEAITNTRVYINITYVGGATVLASTEMTDYSANDAYNVLSCYLWNNPTTYPEAGVTYYVNFQYQAYY